MPKSMPSSPALRHPGGDVKRARSRRRAPSSSRPRRGGCAMPTRQRRAHHRARPRLRRRPRQLAVQHRRARRPRHRLRARPARPRPIGEAHRRTRPRLAVGRSSGFLDAVGIAQGRPRRPFDGRRDRHPHRARPPERVGLPHADRLAGLGPEIDRDYIEGFVAASSRRDLKPVLERLFQDPRPSPVNSSTTCSNISGSTGWTRRSKGLSGGTLPRWKAAAVLAAELAATEVPVLAIWGRRSGRPVAHARALNGRARAEITPTRDTWFRWRRRTA